MSRHDKWIKLLSDFARGHKVTCPNCGSYRLKDAYIELGEHRGWGAWWCEDCKEGLALSRVNLIDDTLRSKIMPSIPNDLKFV